MRYVCKAIAFALLTAAFAQDRGAPAGRQAVTALEHEWLRAEHDRATLERILAPDFLHPVAQGMFLTKKQHIDWAASHPAPPDRKTSFEKLDVRVYGETAIATGIVNDSNLSGHDVRRTIFTDVFVFRDGRWQAVNAQENPLPGPER